MSVSAKITFSITDPNGRDDGVASSLDTDKIELLRREGPVGAGGTLSIIKTIQGAELQPGQTTYTHEDNNVELEIPYFYVAKFYRNSEVSESDETGPIFISGLHEMGYPDNIPSDTDGVPNFIGVAPLLHLSAEYEYNYYGAVEGRAYQGGEVIKNQNELYPDLGWNSSSSTSLRTTSYGIPYINFFGIGADLAVDGPSSFEDMKSNIGVSGDAELVSFDEGLTIVQVATYREFEQSKTIHQDQYAKLSWSGLHNQLLPVEWDVNGTIHTQKGNPQNGEINTGYTESTKNHPRKISDGGYYEPQNIGNYYGPPNGEYWDGARGYWGHRSYYIFKASQSMNLSSSQAIGGISNYNRTDIHVPRDNQVSRTSATNHFYPAGSDIDKVCTMIIRQKEDGSGTQTFINGNIFNTSEHHQSIDAENVPKIATDWHISGKSTGEPTWWEANGYATNFDYLDTNHNPTNINTPNQGYRFHLPAMVNSEGFGKMVRLGGNSRLGLCELMVIPSALSDQDFRRLTTYLSNKYADGMLPQGDYSL